MRVPFDTRIMVSNSEFLSRFPIQTRSGFPPIVSSGILP